MTHFKEAPAFLSVGHVTHDLVNGRIRLGGAALYSARTAFRLGKETAVFTSYGEDYIGKESFSGIPSEVVPARRTSTFRNLYEKGGRVQFLYSQAGPLEVHKLPAAWRKTEIIYLCPVLHEVAMETSWGDPESMVGVAPQGWLRKWNKEGRIEARRWEGFETLLRRAGLLIMSEKDIEGNESLLDEFRRYTKIVIVTLAERGAVAYTPEKTIEVGVYPAKERDPTGAGDCFGASFLIRYRETGDLVEAIRFASCVGSFVVEKDGIEGIPTREDVLRRMEAYSLSLKEI